MPGRRLPDEPIDTALCRRCQEVEPAIVVRTEPVCKSCFSKYVQTKVVKRLESFRVRHSEPGNERMVLLPLSYTASSVTLLHVLSQHLQGQTEKTGRTGFKLCVLHILGGNSANEDDEAPFDDLKARYPQHDYHTVRLSEALASDDVVRSLFADSSNLEIRADDPEQSLRSLLLKAPSATSRQDIEQTLKQRLTISFAKSHACDAVIWDHSATKLAERTISETAKGRGISLPWIVADGDSLHGIPFYHPLRELLNNELKSYVEFADPPFDARFSTVDTKPIVSTKNTTIDDLVEQYFESVEQDYPSIVANVVRTTGKLPVKAIEQAEQCELCCTPLQDRAPEKSRLCHGCIRMLPQAQD
ncbi:unnamed protein product [Zymoseptoria tritici ST99CH_3D7]|uniref:Cytoplasmic tRNA 2-thiolation protein 2 n=1 Tax=Zymoseptoria tritici (strain ST99CH_3D7) TaxID=1276538 RepID=A0A1X7RKC3_ZYMT9|nr:unnamed protein product [Zymoseptoria tritici ST99CH_3D7]